VKNNMKPFKVPERMCIACREMKPKKELLRIVRTPEDSLLVIDKTGKQNGRGAYICCNDDCLKKALKNKSFERSLKVSPTNELIENIEAEVKKNNAQ